MWRVTDNRFVIFLDILGFKKMVADNTHESNLIKIKALFDLANDFETASIFGDSKNSTSKSTNQLKHFTFSDSIIIFSNDNSQSSAKQILNIASLIVAKSLLIGIPIKGAAAYGTITVDTEKSIYFGQSIIDAYELHESLKLFGLIIHSTAVEQFKEKGLLSPPYIFETHYCALKEGYSQNYLVNWIWILYILRKFYEMRSIFPEKVQKQFEEMNEILDELDSFLKEPLKDFETDLSGSARTYVENTAKVLTEMKAFMKDANRAMAFFSAKILLKKIINDLSIK